MTSSPLETFLESLAKNPVAGRRTRQYETDTGLGRLPKAVWNTLGCVAQKPAQTSGPFNNEFKQPISVDIFLPSKLSAINRTGSSTSLLFFSQNSPPLGAVSKFVLGQGTIWIPTAQFTTNSKGASSYFGFQVANAIVTI